jgi:hypothetical protein
MVSFIGKLRRLVDDPETGAEDATSGPQDLDETPSVEPPAPVALDPEEAYAAENRRQWAKLLRELGAGESPYTRIIS